MKQKFSAGELAHAIHTGDISDGEPTSAAQEAYSMLRQDEMTEWEDRGRRFLSFAQGECEKEDARTHFPGANPRLGASNLAERFARMSLASEGRHATLMGMAAHRAMNKQNQRDAIATLVWDTMGSDGTDDSIRDGIRRAVRANGWHMASDAPHLWSGPSTPGVFDDPDVELCRSIIKDLPGYIERTVSAGAFLMDAGRHASVEEAIKDAVRRTWGETTPRTTLIAREATRGLLQARQADEDDVSQVQRPGF